MDTNAQTGGFCTECGTQWPAEGRFCIGCGASRQGHTTGAPGAELVSQPFTGVGAACEYCAKRPRDVKDPFDAYCRVCRKLDPLGPDYVLPIDAYMWSLDAQAMASLRSITPLMAAAQALSEKVGRPWLESTVNGIRLGPDQLPDIFELAIKAARIVGLPYLPEIYISGEQMWDCLTLGSESQAFVVIGSIISNFRGDDMLYVLGREMGHIAAGHALWKTLMQFTTGRQQGKTIMGHGVMQFLNPAKLVESAIDAPLMAWARHSEITADRAGALVIGSYDVARRVAIQWTVRSFPLLPRLNLDALEREVAQSDDRQLQVSEWTMSSTPYLARRLRLMKDYSASDTVKGWRDIIQYWEEIERARVEAAARPPLRPAPPEPQIKDGIRLTCIACGEVMRVSRAELEGKESVRIQCPNAACAKILDVTPKPPDKAEVRGVVPPSFKLKCVACDEGMQVPVETLMANPETHVRCPNPDCRKVLTLRRPPLPAPPPPPDKPDPSLTSE